MAFQGVSGGVPLVDFGELGNLGKVYSDARQKAQRDAILATPTDGTTQSLGALGAKLIQAGDMQGGISLLHLADAATRDTRDFGFRKDEAARAQGNTDRTFTFQEKTASPEFLANRERAVETVKKEFTPNTANIKTPGGEEITVEKGPNGYRVPTVQGLPAPDTNLPPGVDPKAYREARSKQLANIDDKAVLEADKNVQAGVTAIGGLQKALQLSKTAHAGLLAEKRGYAGALFGTADMRAAGNDTIELTNTVTNQALENLRATFGGNPTEGERKILLDVQGAASLPTEARDRIYKNAIVAAQKRNEFNKQLADDMRSGKYLLPQNQRTPQQAAVAPGAPPVISEPTAAPAQAPAAPQPAAAAPADVPKLGAGDQAAFNAMPSGTRFIDPEGQLRIKP